MGFDISNMQTKVLTVCKENKSKRKKQNVFIIKVITLRYYTKVKRKKKYNSNSPAERNPFWHVPAGQSRVLEATKP